MPGRGGVEVLNPAVAEARMARVALARILGQVDIPEVGTSRSAHARRAALATLGLMSRLRYRHPPEPSVHDVIALLIGPFWASAATS